MKHFVLGCLLLACFATGLHAAGVVINGSSITLSIMRLEECDYEAEINNQVAVVTVTEKFTNLTANNFSPRFYYPLPEGASATRLRWFLDNVWYTALIAGNPQNPPGGPSYFPQYFTSYVGAYPVIFDFNSPMSYQESIIVELSYVQLLPYSFGNVGMTLRNNYQSIQSVPLIHQSFSIELISDRDIVSFITPGTNSEINVDTHLATAVHSASNVPATADYQLQYSVLQDALSLASLSSEFTQLPDELGDGVFTFIAEPDNAEAEYLNKVFTFIIDRSGSMSGNKIVQARAAASYIVNNLNDGDMFNLISFATNVTPLWNEHHSYNAQSRQEALNYISTLNANGSTNISGAFDSAIPQFGTTTDDTANIIIFFTDGQATSGITNTQSLVNHVNDQVQTLETTIYLFNFGIGTDVNTQLLTLLAMDNNGSAAFLGNNELESAITSFYDLIRYPVMLSPVFSVTPAAAITEVFPNPLPNMYKGQQLIVSGRYSDPQPISITFSGNVYGQAVSHTYNALLNEGPIEGMEFLPKIWAKQKIESLLQVYYTYPENSAQALQIRQQIIDISVAYGIVCIFTSFSGGVEGEDDVAVPPAEISVKLLPNYPNPFNPSTTLRFELLSEMKGDAVIRIYNLKGQLVRTLSKLVNSKGLYEVVWDGLDERGQALSSGVYYYTVSLGDYLLTGKMTMMK